MDGVTDHPFRFIQKKYGQPAVVYTEFTSVEGVCHGADRLLSDFLFDETQRPVVAQIYGTTPDYFRQSATVLCELGFDGIDINMGCPAKNVAHSGAGAALIKNPTLAQEIIRETKAGVQDYLNGKSARDCENIVEKIWREVENRHQQLPLEYQQLRELPVSVKTRVGYDEKVVDSWIPTLLEMEPAAIAVHGRTLKQQYGGEANWEAIAEGATFAKTTNTLYLGNGDVKSRADAYQKIATYDLDGVLIGRSSFGNPFVFAEQGQPAAINIYQIALEHALLFEKTFSHEERYNFLPMRKHLGWYIKSIPYATEIRQEIFRTNNAEEVKTVFEKYQLI